MYKEQKWRGQLKVVGRGGGGNQTIELSKLAERGHLTPEHLTGSWFGKLQSETTTTSRPNLLKLTPSELQSGMIHQRRKD